MTNGRRGAMREDNIIINARPDDQQHPPSHIGNGVQGI